MFLPRLKYSNRKVENQRMNKAEGQYNNIIYNI